MCDEDVDAFLELPLDARKPLFVYGNLKPGEIAHDLISDQVSHVLPGKIGGYIWVRDGVPLADVNSSSRLITGHVLQLAAEGYARVCEFEPATYVPA